MSRRIEARLKRAAKPTQKSQTFLSSFLPSQLLLPLSFLLRPFSLLSPPACYHLKTLPRGPTHSRVSWRLRLLRICRIGKCKVMGSWGREGVAGSVPRWGHQKAFRVRHQCKAAHKMKMSLPINSREEGGKLLPRGTSSRHFARGEGGVSVTRVPLIR